MLQILRSTPMSIDENTQKTYPKQKLQKVRLSTKQSVSLGFLQLEFVTLRNPSILLLLTTIIFQSMIPSTFPFNQIEATEITLYELNEGMVDAAEVNLDELLKSYDPATRKHLIVNLTHNKIIDSREANTERMLYPLGKTSYMPKKTNSEKEPQIKKQRKKSKSVWEFDRKESDQLHMKFLETICQEKIPEFFAFLDKKKQIKPIDVNYRFQSNWTAIHYAVMNNGVSILARLINYPTIDVNAVTNFGQTALHIGAKLGKLQHCELLINAGVCIDKRDQDLNTAIHNAAELGFNKIILLLLKSGASKELINNRGLLPIQLCTTKEASSLFSNNGIPTQEQSPFTNRDQMRRHQIEDIINGNQQSLNIIQKKLAVKKSTPMDRRHKNILKFYDLIKGQHLLEPIRLSSFKFYKKIGEGAFGEVYIVRKENSDQLYALKAVPKEKVIGTHLERYIQTEKDVLSLIQHPFLVKLHFAFQTESHLFLVMDYCEGGDMSKALKKKKSFDQESVKKYAVEILLAIEVLHLNKILYRDLKPENIVLDRDGHALVTDFGLSKRTENIDDMNKSFCGTPAYLPLEIINKKGHNRMADWYEYGIVLYELFTGFPPFYAETKPQLYNLVREGRLRFTKDAPRQFRDLISKLLAQNPQKRLGIEKDAESIKQDPWFAGVNWNAVLERKQVMPPIDNRIKLGDPINVKFQEENTGKAPMFGWSFIS